MDERERRLAANEALCREVNERIGDLAGTHGDPEHLYEFLCECANADCTFRVPVSIAGYERVRSDPRWFVLEPGHNLPEVETVVERHEDYWIVEKQGEAAEYVERRDPRR